MANRKNLANGFLAGPIDSDDTAATLGANEGLRMASTPFYATITPEGVMSTVDNSEIVSVTDVTDDTLTIVRAQKGTTAKSFSAGSVLVNGIYAEDLDGFGDVVGPASSTDNALVRFDDTTGELIADTTAVYDPGTETFDFNEGALVIGSGSVDVGGDFNVFGGVYIDTVSTDNVVEKTLDAGVTVDGVLIKDGEVDGIDLGAITATETELNYTDGVTSAIQTQLDGKQPLDSDLTTIAGLTPTTDNFMVATSSAWASRTPTQARSQMGLGSLATASTISNSDWSGTDLSVSNGGTGVSTLPSGEYLKGNGTSAVQSESLATLSAAVGNLLMPIGFIYVSGVSTNPNTLLGFGTWIRIEGRFLVGVSDTDGEFDLNDIGGAKTHTLTISEMPSHTHNLQLRTTGSGGAAQATANLAAGSTNNPGTLSGSAGSDGAHNNLPPFIAKYIWQRQA